MSFNNKYVNHYSKYIEKKVSIVECVIRPLKSMMRKDKFTIKNCSKI